MSDLITRTRTSIFDNIIYAGGKWSANRFLLCVKETITGLF